MKEPGDIIDKANDRAEEILNDALSAHYRNREDLTPLSDECIECGETITPERRAAVPKAVRCSDCQRDHERWARLWP